MDPSFARYVTRASRGRTERARVNTDAAISFAPEGIEGFEINLDFILVFFSSPIFSSVASYRQVTDRDWWLVTLSCSESRIKKTKNNRSARKTFRTYPLEQRTRTLTRPCRSRTTPCAPTFVFSWTESVGYWVRKRFADRGSSLVVFRTQRRTCMQRQSLFPYHPTMHRTPRRRAASRLLCFSQFGKDWIVCLPKMFPATLSMLSDRCSNTHASKACFLSRVSACGADMSFLLPLHLARGNADTVL